MADEFLTKPCSLSGKWITGANWYYPHCKLCVCFLYGINIKELGYPECGRNL